MEHRPGGPQLPAAGEHPQASLQTLPQASHRPRLPLRTQEGSRLHTRPPCLRLQEVSPRLPGPGPFHPRDGRIIFAELKRDNEYPKTEQRLWLAGLMAAAEEMPNVYVKVWRP